MKTVLAAFGCAAILAFAAASAACAEAAAATVEAAAQPSYNIMGPSTCAGWPRSGAITSAAKAVPLNWAIGFVSGSATAGNLPLLDQVDPEMMDAWLTTYCKAHPSASFPLAVRTLEQELEAKLPQPPARSPEPPMFVPAAPAPAAPAPAPAKAGTHKAAPKKAPSTPAAAKPG